MANTEALDVVVVGAGFGGLYLLHRLRGLGFSACAIERAPDVGGTWYWNRYPGARCDVESMQYSFSFDEALQQEWHWTERFAAQPEILAYARHVAERFDLLRDIRFETSVTAARFDDAAQQWIVGTSRNDTIRCRFLIMATGCLSNARVPDIAGISEFRGRTFHTGHWPQETIDFTGRRVGVIGTGSSAIQAIPVIGEQARHLTVFQRTPNFSIPARNAPMDTAYEQSWKRDYAALRRRAREETTSGTLYERSTRRARETAPAERLAEYERRWAMGGANFMHAFMDLATDKESNDTAAEFVRGKIRETVKDPATAEALCPKDYPIGTKRICIDTGYFETFNRPNVTLADLRGNPIERITQDGIKLAKGEVALDDIVFATGFDAMTGALLGVDIVGRDGLTLNEAWRAGPVSYLGLMVNRFPNLFTVTGPGSPSVLSNMVFSIEQHVDWIVGCIASLRARNAATIEAKAEAQADWVAHVNEVAHGTLYPSANSWYMGANIPGKPRVFMPYIGGVVPYRQKCDQVAAEGYAGFIITPAPAGGHSLAESPRTRMAISR